MKQPLLIFSTGYFTYIGRAVDTIIHDHHAIQLALSFQNKIEIILPESTMKLKGVIIDSDQPHECRTKDNTFLLINVDPECKVGSGLKKQWLADQKIAALPETMVESLLEKIRPLLLNRSNTDSIHQLTLEFISKLSNTVGNEELDERVIRVLEVLNEPGDLPVKIKDLAQNVYLSPSRLVHLFKEQVGIPVRKYALWARLLISLKLLINSKDMTTAALKGGFSDAPHFNRTFKRMFGLNPSSLLKNSQIIQASLE